MTDSAEAPEGAPAIHNVEFRGRGGEYFRIWIVNLALSLLTLGLYTAWAKVRTQRYFYGNTYVAGHSFEYHASPWRILLGRAIAIALFAGYSLSVIVLPATFALWLLILGAALPWLANSSIRFNARNTSWRNVRFNFAGTYFEAFIAYVVWTLVAFVLPFVPYARRVQDYFYVNHHRFGGRPFTTAFSAGRIYAIYLLGFIVIVGLLLGFIAVAGATVEIATHMHNILGQFSIPIGPNDFGAIVIALFALGALFVSNFVTTQVTNLSIGHTVLDGGFRLASRASGLRVAYIVTTNALLTVLTLGIFYPFGRVRLARYRMSKFALIAEGDLDGFTSEALETQSAIGEEIAGFFDFGFGL